MKKILLVLLLLPGVLPILANTPPRLVINLVVSSMRPDDIDRYRSQFGTGGFLRLTEGGARFTEGSYDYQQTSTPVSLATLTTGAMPSTHGVISTRWRDYIDVYKRQVLIETMRREGYELQVGQPKVIVKEIDGKKCEPIEEMTVDCPQEYSGTVIELATKRKGTPVSYTHLRQPHPLSVLPDSVTDSRRTKQGDPQIKG